jgi:fermentation-respiration switch protein FrsA (DUF1100 family)
VPVSLRAADGVGLHAWFLPAQGKARATVLYLHGNAENISTHFVNVAWMPAAGFNVLALDYRGYGASEGEPSVGGAQLDIDAAMQALLARDDVDASRIIVFGQSLGAALAIHYVAHSAYRDHVRAVIADSAFADYRLIARETLARFILTWPFQWLPWLTVDNTYAPRDSVAGLAPVALLLIHGEQDGIIGTRYAQMLFEAARQPKELWLVPETGHIQALKRESVRERLTRFIERAAR